MNELGWRCTALAVLGLAQASLGRYEEALDCAELSRELGTNGDTVNEIWWRLNRTTALTGLGDYEEAERVGRETVAITAPTDAVVFHADALTELARVLRLAGRDGEAAELVDEALAIAEHKDAPAIADRARAALT